jgi:hypothetical protein
MDDVLFVVTDKSSAPPVKVPYHRLMPLYDFLKHVLAPACGSTFSDEGRTVNDCFRYISEDGCVRVRFDRVNRNLCVGDRIPPGAILTRFANRHPNPKGGNTLFGNAIRGDLTQTCCVCMDETEQTDYELKGCAHRFHMRCAWRVYTNGTPLCPVCRMPFSEEDRF